MRGYDKPDPVDEFDQQKDQDAEKDAETIADQVEEEENQVEENVDNVNFNLLSLVLESDVPSSHVDDPLNVQSDQYALIKKIVC